jgi:hypothetical protein
MNSEVPNRRARLLSFFRCLSTLLAIYHVMNEKFHPAHLLIYVVNKQVEWHFFSNPAHYSGLLVCLGLQSNKAINKEMITI